MDYGSNIYSKGSHIPPDCFRRKYKSMFKPQSHKIWSRVRLFAINLAFWLKIFNLVKIAINQHNSLGGKEVIIQRSALHYNKADSLVASDSYFLYMIDQWELFAFISSPLKTI